jgi:hypothetical protein
VAERLSASQEGPGYMELVVRRSYLSCPKLLKEFRSESTPNVRSQVLTAVSLKSSVFWDITPCSLVKIN